MTIIYYLGARNDATATKLQGGYADTLNEHRSVTGSPFYLAVL